MPNISGTSAKTSEEQWQRAAKRCYPKMRSTRGADASEDGARRCRVLEDGFGRRDEHAADRVARYIQDCNCKFLEFGQLQSKFGRQPPGDIERSLDTRVIFTPIIEAGDA